MQRCGVDCRGQKVTFGVMETFCEYILTIVVVAHLYTLFRVHQSVHLKGVNFAACKFHLDKPALTGGARRAGVSSSPDSCRAWPGLRGQLLRQVLPPWKPERGREGRAPFLDCCGALPGLLKGVLLSPSQTMSHLTRDMRRVTTALQIPQAAVYPRNL